MTTAINWIDLRHRLEAAGVPGVLRLSHAQVLAAVNKLPADTSQAQREAARAAGVPNSPMVAKILEIVAKGAWQGKQVIKHLDDGSVDKTGKVVDAYL